MAVVLSAIAFAGAAAIGVAIWLRWQWLIVTIVGASMEPTLRDGDRVLVRRARPARLRRDQLVVIDSPYRTPGPGSDRMVKRLVALPGDPVPAAVEVSAIAVPAGNVVVLGDNPAMSVDSRTLGFFAADNVIGVVIRTLGPMRTTVPIS